MKLSKIHIYNYRKLKNCDIEFDDKQTVFVGANNSGKTSAMQAIITFLKDNNRFTANDFTLSNWVSLNEFAEKWIDESIGKQSLRAVLRTLIKMYTFAPNFKFGTK